jgi:hypothetical protein
MSDESKQVCPKCGSNFSQRVGWGGVDIRFQCGSVFHVPENQLESSRECVLRNQLAANERIAELESQVKQILDDIAVLQVQVMI